jgi:hypothetical protein
MSGSGVSAGSGAGASRATARTKAAGHQAAGNRTLQIAGRLGLIGRGVLYILIGLIALQVAAGGGGGEADSTGALQKVAESPFGGVALWLLAVGFAGLAVWQLAVALVNSAMETKDRFAAGARVILYTVLCVTTVLLATGSGGQESSDQQSQSLTASAMENGFGRFLVGAVGLALVAVGILLAVRGVKRHFLRHLDFTGASPRTRKAVEWLGLVGNIARGVVFGAVGAFLVQAAITYDPEKARGLDGALRSFTGTPLGPWLLVAVALGLILFGVYSCAQSKFQKPEAGAASS